MKKVINRPSSSGLITIYQLQELFDDDIKMVVIEKVNTKLFRTIKTSDGKYMSIGINNSMVCVYDTLKEAINAGLENPNAEVAVFSNLEESLSPYLQKNL